MSNDSASDEFINLVASKKYPWLEKLILQQDDYTWRATFLCYSPKVISFALFKDYIDNVVCIKKFIYYSDLEKIEWLRREFVINGRSVNKQEFYKYIQRYQIIKSLSGLC